MFGTNNLVQREYVHLLILGTLSKEEDDDDSENVCKKINYVIASNFGPAQYVKCRRLVLRFYSGSKQGTKIRRRMSTSSIKRQIGRFHVVVVQWTTKKCTKKSDARPELLF